MTRYLIEIDMTKEEDRDKLHFFRSGWKYRSVLSSLVKALERGALESPKDVLRYLHDQLEDHGVNLDTREHNEH